MLARADQAMTDAYGRLGDAADWLRSDWRPGGSPLTDAQAARRRAMLTAIETAKPQLTRRRLDRVNARRRPAPDVRRLDPCTGCGTIIRDVRHTRLPVQSGAGVTQDAESL